MSHFAFPADQPSVPRLPYALASLAQRAELLAFVRQRLRHHFPTLSSAVWLLLLFEFQPTLVLVGPAAVTLDEAELRQLVQFVASHSRLALLDPPIYGLPALDLAQHWQRGRDLALAACPELPAGPSGRQLATLLAYLTRPYPLADQVVQAWRWDLASSPPLPPGLPLP